MFGGDNRHADGDYRKSGLVRSGIRALSGSVGLVSECIDATKQGKPDAALTSTTTTSSSDTKPAETVPPTYSEVSQDGVCI